jgi:hypothetical protein
MQATGQCAEPCGNQQKLGKAYAINAIGRNTRPMQQLKI